MNEIQQMVGRGEYEVDTDAVADAILRRLLLRPGRAPSTDTVDGGE
jgi:hypothetical protein